MIKEVRKRTGETVLFSSKKIQDAIEKAMHAIDLDTKKSKQFTKEVVSELNSQKIKIPDVEQIQETVEKVLEKHDSRLFKIYSLYRRSRHHAREIKKYFKIKDDLKLSVNALKVLEERYLLKDSRGKIIETPTEMFLRVSKAISENKKQQGQFFNAMKNLEFLPNSPTLMNAGTKLGQLSACFVLPIEDSLESIFKTLDDMAIIQQSGGGTGFSFSKIRPKGDIVKSTKGIASGPVSFMKIYDATTETIKQGGKRRGANMGILSVNHPDIIEFVNSKKYKKLSNFNISVSATDSFLEKAMKNQNFNLVNPRNHEVVGKINAKQLFDLIISNAWQSGDPGMIFIDEINRKNPLKEKIESTNPCVAEGSLISTNEGLIPIEKVHNPYFISTTNGLNPVSWAGETGIKEVFNIKTAAGFEVNATADHKLLTKDGWKKIEELTKKDSLILGKCPFGNLKISKEESLALGWLIGDGHLTKDEKRVIFYFNNEDKKDMLVKIKPFLDKLNENPVKIQEQNSETRIKYSSKVAKFFLNLGIKYRKAKEKEIPESIFRMEKESVKNIISSIFGADGSVQGNKEKGISIRLASSSLKLLKQTQLLLLQFNILSKVYENRRKAGKRVLPDSTRKPKEFDCNADHELIISRESAFRFMKEIGFSVKTKQEKFEKIKPSKIYKDNIDLSVKEIKKIGLMKVYDITEPKTHSFVANGLIVHNCGEVPLLPYESCNLGSINLAKVFDNKKINWNKLRELTYLGVEFLNNVIDKNKYPLPEIEKITKKNRKIGLGVMGFADLLLLMKTPYGSSQSFRLADKIMSFIKKEARKKSKKNITLTTIAPTGTISIIAGCSSGIEPLFALAFFREVLENKKLAEINPIFQNELIKRNLWNEKTIKEIMKTGSIQKTKLPKDIKKIFITSLDISPDIHVKMQAVFQKHVDNAVSKTVNLPENASREEVKRIYLLAWKLKCKGITIYRYNSKEKQVLYKGTAGLIAKPQFSGGCPSGVCQL
jgi:ribonucleoside-diphosphate reductase alpha chain